jgi:two-component system NarL family sensor kinase
MPSRRGNASWSQSRTNAVDGLGPSLTASAFRLDAARRVLTTRPEQSDELIGAARADVAEALNDIRRLVYELRPPALDDLGLVGALRRHLDVPAGPGALVVTLDADEDLPTMPAAVEVAAYRIVTEAVRKHSGAQHCRVTLRGGPQLRIEILDDGASDATAPRHWTPGVGLSAMVERVREVGGHVDAGPTSTGGQVRVTLPLAAGGHA